MQLAQQHKAHKVTHVRQHCAAPPFSALAASYKTARQADKATRLLFVDKRVLFLVFATWRGNNKYNDNLVPNQLGLYI